MGPLRVPEDCPQEVADLQQMCVSGDYKDRPSSREIVAVLSRLQRSPQRMPSTTRKRPPTVDVEQPAAGVVASTAAAAAGAPVLEAPAPGGLIAAVHSSSKHNRISRGCQQGQ
jgi:hypothetical protein